MTPLRHKKATTTDQIGNTLLIGGGSPKELQQVQHRVLQKLNSPSFTSATHETLIYYQSILLSSNNAFFNSHSYSATTAGL